LHKRAREKKSVKGSGTIPSREDGIRITRVSLMVGEHLEVSIKHRLWRGAEDGLNTPSCKVTEGEANSIFEKK